MTTEHEKIYMNTKVTNTIRKEVWSFMKEIMSITPTKLLPQSRKLSLALSDTTKTRIFTEQDDKITILKLFKNGRSPSPEFVIYKGIEEVQATKLQRSKR